MIIAIDGPAGSGKSSIARMLAQGLSFVYVNSGNLYRAFTLGIIRHGLQDFDSEQIVAYAKNTRVEYIKGHLFLDGEDVDDLLHTESVDSIVAQVSSIPSLRDIVNKLVRSIADDMDAVVEGRDMTTVVFPDAAYKFYLDASPESRARRRLAQGTSGDSLDLIRRNIEMRDEIDRSKSVGALKIASDAYYLDTSDLTIKEVYDNLYGKILH